MPEDTFHRKLKKLINEYVLFVYAITKNFPRNELYSVTSQFRRAAISIILNYIEGYSRKKPKVKHNFYEIS